MKKALTLMTIAGFSVLALTGCTQQNTPAPIDLTADFKTTDISKNFFADTENPIEEYTELPLITDLKSDSFVFVTGGSGSCVPEVKDIIVTPLTNTIELEPLGDVACTADFVLYAYEITLEDGINPDIIFQVQNGEQTTTATVK